MKHLKRFIALLLIVSSLLLSSCGSLDFGGIDYFVYEDHVAVCGYSGNLETVYIPPTYKGLPVEYVDGKKDSYFIGSSRTARFDGNNLKKVYFPWCTRSEINSDSHTVHITGDDVVVFFTRYDDVIPTKKLLFLSRTIQNTLKLEESDAGISPIQQRAHGRNPQTSHSFLTIPMHQTTIIS